MTRLRLFFIAAILLATTAAVVFFTNNVDTQAAEGPYAEMTPVIQRPDLPPTPTQAAPPEPQALPQGTVLLEDTFDSEDSNKRWQAVDLVRVPSGEEARWGVRDGQMHQRSSGMAASARTDGTVAVAGSAEWTDYTYTVSAYPMHNTEMGVVFRYQDAKNFYRVRLLSDILEAKNKLVLEKFVDGKRTVLASQPGPGYQKHHWSTFKVTVDGSRIQVQVNDLPALEAEDSTLARGKVGLYALAIGMQSFDSALVVAP